MLVARDIVVRVVLGPRGRAVPGWQPALDDGAVEQPLRLWRQQQREHVLAAGGLPEEGDVLGVTAEAGRVGFDPPEALDEVQQPEVPRLLLGVRRRRPEGVVGTSPGYQGDTGP